MNLEFNSINIFDFNYHETDSNFLLELDKYSNNEIFDSSPDSLKLNDDLLLSIFSPACQDSNNVHDHAYCILPEKHELFSDLLAPQFMHEISDNKLENNTEISFADIDFCINDEKIFVCPANNAETTDSKEQISLQEQIPLQDISQSSYFINSDIYPDYLSEYSTENLQNEFNSINEYNVNINDNFADKMNTFDIDEEYESLSDDEDILLNKLKTNSLKKNFLPMTIQDIKPNRRTKFKDNCQLVITQEEKKLLSEQGFNLPTNVPLTREEDRILKAVRRKIRNKYAAKMSRLKKQDYMEGLERRVKFCTSQNQQLQYKVVNLEKQNNMLMKQLKQLQNLISKNNPLSNESMESLSRFANNRHAQTGTCLMVFILSFSLFILPSLTPFFASNQPDTLPIFGNSRKILQFNSPPVLSTDNFDEFVSNQNSDSNYLHQDSINYKSSGYQLINTEAELNKFKKEINLYESKLIEDVRDGIEKIDHTLATMNIDQDFISKNFVLGEMDKDVFESNLKKTIVNQEIRYQHILSNNNISTDKSLVNYKAIFTNTSDLIDGDFNSILTNTTLELKNFDLKNQNITNLSLPIGEKDL